MTAAATPRHREEDHVVVVVVVGVAVVVVGTRSQNRRPAEDVRRGIVRYGWAGRGHFHGVVPRGEGGLGVVFC